MKFLEIELPWPPTVNTYWRMVNSRILISKKGRLYREIVAASILEQIGFYKPIKSRVAVIIQCFPPDRRKRDLDNLPKALFDSLTYAGVWDDDEQIDDFRITRKHVVKPGYVNIYICEI